MIRYLIVSLANGIVFGILDTVINANPFARELFQVYKPTAKRSVNSTAGIFIDLLYGLIMGFIFLLFYSALPGNTGIIKGISFALIIWFFRVLMNVVSSWMMFDVPKKYISLYGTHRIIGNADHRHHLWCISLPGATIKHVTNGK